MGLVNEVTNKSVATTHATKDMLIVKPKKTPL